LSFISSKEHYLTDTYYAEYLKDMNSDSIISFQSQNSVLPKSSGELVKGSQIIFRRDYETSDKLLVRNGEVLQVLSNKGGDLIFRNFDGQEFTIGVRAKGTWFDVI